MWLVNEQTIRAYQEAAKRATVDDAFFRVFKTSEYADIVGMGQDWQFPYFLEYVKKFPVVYNAKDKIALNDKYGGLKTMDFDGTNMSVNTARYAKTVAEIYNYFGSLNDKVVTEIGVGYGGLCYVANSVFNIETYHLIDLPIPQDLAMKYTKKLGINNASLTKPEKSFLTISEFALSELSIGIVQAYYNDILKHSENLYLMINIHDNDRKREFLEVISEDFDIQLFDEYPKTHWPNDLIIGRHK